MPSGFDPSGVPVCVVYVLPSNLLCRASWGFIPMNDDHWSLAMHQSYQRADNQLCALHASQLRLSDLCISQTRNEP